MIADVPTEAPDDVSVMLYAYYRNSRTRDEKKVIKIASIRYFPDGSAMLYLSEIDQPDTFISVRPEDLLTWGELHELRCPECGEYLDYELEGCDECNKIELPKKEDGIIS